MLLFSYQRDWSLCQDSRETHIYEKANIYDKAKQREIYSERKSICLFKDNISFDSFHFVLLLRKLN